MKPARLLDLLIALFVLIWLAGGVPWHGRLVLTHGADPRRAAVLLTTLGAAVWPAFRRDSLWLALVRRLIQRLKSAHARWALGGAVLALAVAQGVLQALALRTPLYDVGLFHQVLWAVARGQGFRSSVSGAGNFLLDHLSPSLVLLAPAYWISGGSALALPVLNPLLLGAGVAAWVWLAARLSPGESELPGATLLFAIFFESLWGNLHWGFHETTLYFALASWGLALFFEARARGDFERGRRLIVLGLLMAAALCKEILLVDVALFLGAVAYEGRRRKRVAIVLIPVAAMLLAAFLLYEWLPHPADKNYFVRYYGYLGENLGDFAWTLGLRPWRVVAAVGAWPLLKYAFTVFLPWLGLPLRQPAYLAGIAASVASSAIATYPPLRGASFHYVLALWPMLACLTLVGLARRPPSGRLKWAWVWLALLSWDSDPLAQVWEYARGAGAAGPVIARLREIPPEDSVSASELAGTWVAARAKAYRWPARGPVANQFPDWVVLQGQRLNYAQCPAPEGWSEAWREGDWRAYRRNSP